MTEACIPYGAYWSTPFARWQGALAHLHAVEFAAWVTKRALAERGIDPASIDHGVLGTTIPQQHSFYGMPWLAGMLGAPDMTGPTISQACATSARCLAEAEAEVKLGRAASVLVVTADRTSNGPHVYYPDPGGQGGTGAHENWVLDNFARDPHANVSMIQAGEKVAKQFGIGTEEQHEWVLRSYARYEDAKADQSAFLRRFMTLPFDVPDRRYRATAETLQGDEGIHDTSAEKLARLRPVMDGGSITFGGQTHPADGGAGMVVTDAARAREMSADAGIDVRILAVGQSRVAPAMMPTAPVPAARAAMRQAGVAVSDLAAVKTHNPFIVNDIVLVREMGIDPGLLNNYGSSLVWGHPQGPTGLRAVIELIEELAMRGGGVGLFTGCAAGDTGMAVVLRVSDA
jgi:acetyl-CoA acetyltransferase family protein